MTTGLPARTDAASLRIGEEELDLPIVRGTEGDDAVDIGRLRSETGLITFDPGYGNTGACTSAITFLDGEHGILRYRGYPIEQLAEHSTFLEVAYLLIWGELPTREQLDRFVSEVTHHTLIREEMRHFFDSFPTDAHPMAVLASGVVGMSTFYPDSQNIFDDDAVEITINRLIAKLPTLAAWSFKKAIGQPYVYPRNDLGYSANLLHMMFAVPTEEYEVDPKVAEALDLLLILHADHEQNASTSTVRMVGSTHANLYASISAGISALWGPLHGGANEAVINTLERIVVRRRERPEVGRSRQGPETTASGSPASGIGSTRTSIRGRRSSRRRRIGSFARRVPTTRCSRSPSGSRRSPCATSTSSAASCIPNVDFYSGLIYRAIGFPKNMFTNCFAIGRLPGWIAQWREMMAAEETKIGRPRQVYIGPPTRDYTPIERR